MPGETAKYTVQVTSVTNEFTTKLNRLPTFLVSITNNTPSTLPVSASNVTARSGDQNVRIYDPFDLAKLLRNDAKMKVFLVAAKGRAEIDTAICSQRLSGGTAIIPVQTKALTNLAVAKKEASTELTRATVLLLPYSLPSAGTVTGTVELHPEDITPGQPLAVSVTLGSEKHTFYFDVQS